MDATSNSRVVINVGGVRFETYTSTLQAFPGTKLANLADTTDQKNKEFFFDRNPQVFEYVLDFYRTKHLHCSSDMCQSVLMDELNFWEINSTQLAQCCWLKMNSKAQDMEDLTNWDDITITRSDQEQFLIQTGRVDYTWRGRWQPKVWALFEKPFSSLASMCITAVSVLFNIGAIVIFFEQTKRHFIYIQNTRVEELGETFQPFTTELHHQKVIYLLYLELVCALWFLLELCIRFTFCPNKKSFVRNFLNVVDFISLFPVFVELLAKGNVSQRDILWKVLGFLRMVYIIKLVRVFILIEGSLILKVLSGTLKAIIKEIFILLLVLGFETLFFATLAFYAEWSDPDVYLSNHEHFGDIYSCCWWALITLTTVGYGDIYPMTTFGKIISSFTAISGIMTIVIPIPILMIKFQHYYRIALAKEKLKLHRCNEQKI